MSELSGDTDLIEDLGRYLKKRREERDVSITMLSSRTRIPERFVAAIEENRFSDLPNQVSTKGFLRTYAIFVGLDDAKVLEAFSTLNPASAMSDFTEKEDKALSYLQVKKNARRPFSRRIALLVGGTILLLVALTIFFPKKKSSEKLRSSLPDFSLQSPRKSEIPFQMQPALQEIEAFEALSSEDPPTEESEQSTTNTPDGMVLEGSPLKAANTETAPRPHPEADLEEGLSILSIEAFEPSWVQVTLDGLETREALLQPNDSVSWRAKEKFLLTLGNAGGVKVLLNGKELEPLGPSGEVVHKEIKVTQTELEESE